MVVVQDTEVDKLEAFEEDLLIYVVVEGKRPEDIGLVEGSRPEEALAAL